jgi:hypothetical protein
MVELSPDECRVLGVLVEKAHTVASQYPMSLNALVTGCNQKSNRHPVLALDEDRVVAALEGLRDKGLVLYADTAGSRVMKYKHNAREGLEVSTRELTILAELLLRGPQTSGEIRTRASRMYELGSLDDVRTTLAYMMREREEPLVRRVAPAPGSRAERYAQLLCPTLHPVEDAAGEAAPGASPSLPHDATPALADRVAKLEAEAARLRAAVERLADALGAADMIEPACDDTEAAPGPAAPDEPQGDQ